jgi:uncharacterized protein (TIGR01244 family)
MMTKRLLIMILAAGLSAVSLAEDVGIRSELKVDLAAVVSTGVVTPVDGITSAGQPDEKAFKVFADQGYTTVIDLRTPGEDRGMDEPKVVEDLGMDYVLLPIGRDDITFESAMTLDKLIADADGPVLVHCGSANRVGALLALRKSLDGADDESALEYGRKGGMTRLEGRVKEALIEE